MRRTTEVPRISDHTNFTYLKYFSKSYNMEYSSPLATLRPQPAWGSRKDIPISRSMYSSYQTYGPSSFDFRTMSMHQKPAPQRQDYFNSRPTRGSSPTSSLTADLDANFHIDKRYPHSSLDRSGSMLTDLQSPQAPTPRRSLFTTDLSQPRQNRKWQNMLVLAGLGKRLLTWTKGKS